MVRYEEKDHDIVVDAIRKSLQSPCLDETPCLQWNDGERRIPVWIPEYDRYIVLEREQYISLSSEVISVKDCMNAYYLLHTFN